MCNSIHRYAHIPLFICTQAHTCIYAYAKVFSSQTPPSNGSQLPGTPLPGNPKPFGLLRLMQAPGTNKLIDTHIQRVRDRDREMRQKEKQTERHREINNK